MEYHNRDDLIVGLQLQTYPEELIKAKDAQIESLKEIIKIKDELLNQYRK